MFIIFFIVAVTTTHVLVNEIKEDSECKGEKSYTEWIKETNDLYTNAFNAFGKSSNCVVYNDNNNSSLPTFAGAFLR